MFSSIGPIVNIQVMTQIWLNTLHCCKLCYYLIGCVILAIIPLRFCKHYLSRPRIYTAPFSLRINSTVLVSHRVITNLPFFFVLTILVEVCWI